MKLYANLHLHSTHSDGSYTPTEIAKIAYDEGYRAAALTDHDTVSGNAEFMDACKNLGMDSIFGIEFNTYTDMFYKNDGRKGTFHITAFDFDPEYPPIKEYLWQMSMRETYRTKTLFHRGVDIGYIKGITWDEVCEFNKGITWLCNDHVFRAMKAKGLIDDSQYNDYFQTCFGKHRSQVPRLYDYKDIDEIIKLVHEAGGITCLAHCSEQLRPTEIYKEIGFEGCIRKLIEIGIDGVEVWHRLLNEQEREEVLEIALKHNLFISGGSDHDGLCGGMYAYYEKPEECEFYVEPCSTGTTKEYFEEIKNKKLNR